MKREIYLDNNATTKPLPDVRTAMDEVLGNGFGNASSANASGDRARQEIHNARMNVAGLVGARDANVIFTSGGTEANNSVLLSAIKNACDRPRIITTTTEHSSILKLVDHLRRRKIDVVVLPVDSTGRVNIDLALQAITPETSLVSIQWANNETGVIQPVEELCEICQSQNVPFHTDAAQAVGKIDIDLSTVPFDYLTFTAHKIHGPQGAGVVYARKRALLSPILHGGPQEYGLRAGTENLPGIVGMGRAAELRFQSMTRVIDDLRNLRDTFERRVIETVPDVCINGDTLNRTCNTTNLLFRGIDGQALVAGLDNEGIRCSQSSACTNQRPEPSYVLRAMGLSEEDAYSSVRFSFGVINSLDEIDLVVAAIAENCHRLRKFSQRFHNPYQATRT